MKVIVQITPSNGHAFETPIDIDIDNNVNWSNETAVKNILAYLSKEKWIILTDSTYIQTCNILAIKILSIEK